MLVLQRKKGEAVLLGDEIRISVVECGTDVVKLAIEAPRSVTILREELREAMLANKQAVADKSQIEKAKNILMDSTKRE